MASLKSLPATPHVEPLRIGAGRRTLALSLAVLIPALLLFLLLSFGSQARRDHKDESISVVSLSAAESREDAAEPNKPEPEPSDDARASPQPTAPQPALSDPAEPQPPQAAEPRTPPIAAMPLEWPTPPANPPGPARPSGEPVYGPPDTRPSSSARDSERVGTAPNGEPLYAAAWYREPSDDELRGYLSTASGPGWGLIACRTAPDYRVEDCVGLDEYPTGSQITRAILAAAWAFRVRPPRLGGQPLVGAWVRIRIDYGIKRR